MPISGSSESRTAVRSPALPGRLNRRRWKTRRSHSRSDEAARRRLPPPVDRCRDSQIHAPLVVCCAFQSEVVQAFRAAKRGAETRPNHETSKSTKAHEEDLLGQKQFLFVCSSCHLFRG